jgi:hypothetical protein
MSKTNRNLLLILALLAWHCLTRIIGNNTNSHWQVGWNWFGWMFEIYWLGGTIATAVTVLALYCAIKQIRGEAK